MQGQPSQSDSKDVLEYACVAGHPISPDHLDLDTEIVLMDAGATVRICREHGCPIAITRRARD